MKYAILKTGGKQYKVSVGQTLPVEKLSPTSPTVELTEVLLVVDGEQVEIGTPTVAGVQVTAEVVKEQKGEKLEIFKYKSKSRYRKHTGHRQRYTLLKVTGIGTKETSAQASPPKKTSAKKAATLAKSPSAAGRKKSAK